MVNCLECGEVYSPAHKKCPRCGAPIPYVCKKCKKPLEGLTSECECGGWATENPEKSKSGLVVESNFKRLARYRKVNTVLLVIIFLNLPLLIIAAISQWSFWWLFVLLKIVGSALIYILAFFYHRCPYCDAHLQYYFFREAKCPVCGNMV